MFSHGYSPKIYFEVYHKGRKDRLCDSRGLLLWGEKWVNSDLSSETNQDVWEEIFVGK